MTIGEKIKQARKRKSLTQDKLGEELNLSGKLISRWEKSNLNPRPEALKNLVEILKVPDDYLKPYISDELVFFKIFEKVENNTLVFEYDEWKDKPKYDRILSKHLKKTKDAFEEDLSELFQEDIDNKYFIFNASETKFYIIKKDFTKIIDGKYYAVMQEDTLVIKQLFNKDEEEFYSIDIDCENIEKTINSVENIDEAFNEIKGQNFIGKTYYSGEERYRIAGIIVASFSTLE